MSNTVRILSAGEVHAAGARLPLNLAGPALIVVAGLQEGVACELQAAVHAAPELATDAHWHAVDTLDGSTDYQPVEQALLEMLP